MRPLFCLQALQATGPGTAPGRALACTFPPTPADGSLVAVGGENKLLHIWDVGGDVSPGRLVATLAGFTQRVNASVFLLNNNASAASPAPSLATVASDGYLRIHSLGGDDAGDGRAGALTPAGAKLALVEVPAHEEAANGVDTTHDGAFLVTCSDDMTLKVRGAPLLLRCPHMSPPQALLTPNFLLTTPPQHTGLDVPGLRGGRPAGRPHVAGGVRRLRATPPGRAFPRLACHLPARLWRQRQHRAAVAPAQLRRR